MWYTYPVRDHEMKSKRKINAIMLVMVLMAQAVTVANVSTAADMYQRRQGTTVSTKTILVEAEDFKDRGAWRVDTQFTHEMGSAYLLAAGVLKPIGAAKTRVEMPSAGRWHAWVRTRDWLPTHSPGRFALSVGGVRGPVLGASGKEGWRWERAGDFDLKKGAVELSLDDLSGAFARCDAVLLTDDPAFAGIYKGTVTFTAMLEHTQAEEASSAEGTSYPEEDVNPINKT